MKRVRASKAELRRRRRRYTEAGVLAGPSKSTRRVVFLGLGLVLAAGIIVGRKGLREQQASTLGNTKAELLALSTGLAAPPYTDPSGLFRIVPPASWTRHARGADTSYNIVFRSPNGPDISILATPVEDDSFQDLLRRIDQIERETRIEMNLEISRFKGFKAARRTANLQHIRVLAIDFATEGVAHHIQFSSHPFVFDTYLPAIMKVIETYEPLPSTEPRA